MRDDSQLYDLYEVEDDADQRPSRLGAAIAATAALALLAGVVTWSYRLGVRDANEVPVIRAAEGPSRVRPEDPGGAQFEHQGRAVYGAMSGAVPAPAEITLAPAPESLAD
ncbi:MAG: SPOR domain-containing protein, partial [Rubrimonas sp.]